LRDEWAFVKDRVYIFGFVFGRRLVVNAMHKCRIHAGFAKLHDNSFTNSYIFEQYIGHTIGIQPVEMQG
jgi:hypothetical protein